MPIKVGVAKERHDTYVKQVLSAPYAGSASRSDMLNNKSSFFLESVAAEERLRNAHMATRHAAGDPAARAQVVGLSTPLSPAAYPFLSAYSAGGGAVHGHASSGSTAQFWDGVQQHQHLVQQQQHVQPQKPKLSSRFTPMSRLPAGFATTKYDHPARSQGAVEHYNGLVVPHVEDQRPATAVGAVAAPATPAAVASSPAPAHSVSASVISSPRAVLHHRGKKRFEVDVQHSAVVPFRTREEPALAYSSAEVVRNYQVAQAIEHNRNGDLSATTTAAASGTATPRPARSLPPPPTFGMQTFSYLAMDRARGVVGLELPPSVAPPTSASTSSSSPLATTSSSSSSSAATADDSTYFYRKSNFVRYGPGWKMPTRAFFRASDASQPIHAHRRLDTITNFSEQILRSPYFPS